MNTEQFAIWLHGFFELTDAEELTKGQVKMIKEHLNLCFDKKTPPLEFKTDTEIIPSSFPSIFAIPSGVST